ncbi:MAG: hypothetical protein PHY54_20395, partial [Methylococcales bacterium]|nr:hypothetical protein [Methylococcales bacterium]
DLLGVYSAYIKDKDNALAIGQAAGRAIPIWSKSAGSEDPSGISVPEWAENVKVWVTANYLPFCFNQAATHLPCHLAETAGHINGVVGKDNKNDAQIFARQSFHFWTLVLQLSSAQAMAIARSAGISFMVPSDHTYEALEKMLTDLLPVLQSKSSVSLWTPYIGDDGKQFINGSRAIRLLRNQHSHETPLEDYREQNKEMIPNLQKIMDAAIFWANHPLLTDIRPCGGSRYKAKVIKGTGYPWAEQEFQMDAADLNPDHVYLKYSSPYSDTVKLIDLWPFVTLEFNRDLNRPCLFLISHRWKNNWYRVSMNNGHPEIWKPSSDVLQVFE